MGLSKICKKSMAGNEIFGFYQFIKTIVETCSDFKLFKPFSHNTCLAVGILLPWKNIPLPKRPATRNIKSSEDCLEKFANGCNETSTISMKREHVSTSLPCLAIFPHFRFSSTQFW